MTTRTKQAQDLYILFSHCQELPGVQAARRKLLDAIKSQKEGRLESAILFAGHYEKMCTASLKLRNQQVEKKQQENQMDRLNEKIRNREVECLLRQANGQEVV